MSEYYLKAIILNNCPYSNAAQELLQNFKIPSKIININSDEKEKYKSKYIQTFPQIYLNKYNSKENLLLGGYDDLNFFINTFKGKIYEPSNVEKFMNKYKWSKKATLRTIQLVNSI